jgi:hypothetical protein
MYEFLVAALAVLFVLSGGGQIFWRLLRLLLDAAKTLYP